MYAFRPYSNVVVIPKEDVSQLTWLEKYLLEGQDAIDRATMTTVVSRRNCRQEKQEQEPKEQEPKEQEPQEQEPQEQEALGYIQAPFDPQDIGCIYAPFERELFDFSFGPSGYQGYEGYDEYDDDDDEYHGYQGPDPCDVREEWYENNFRWVRNRGDE